MCIFDKVTGAVFRTWAALCIAADMEYTDCSYYLEIKCESSKIGGEKKKITK